MNENENGGSSKNEGSGIIGFCSALILAIPVYILIKDLAGIIFEKNSFYPLVIINFPGPFSGLILWAVFQESRKRFARGALMFAFVWYAAINIYWTVMVFGPLFWPSHHVKPVLLYILFTGSS